MDSDLIFARYYNLSLRYLSYRPRSEKEVQEYLREKIKKNKLNLKSEVEGDEIIEQILIKLKVYRFIDDEAFLKFWFEQRTKYKKKPFKVVKFELVQKGIKRSLIESYFENFGSKEIDLENAKSLAEKKLNYYRNLDSVKRKEKVMRYLLGKGFSYETVKKIL